MYANEHENELQLINLRNEVTNQITVDICGERCARLDDFNWVLPAKVWNEGSDTPESDFETSDSGNGVHVNASDSSSPETETTSQRLFRRDLKGAVRQQCPGEAPAAECPDDGQCFSDGYKTGVRRPKYIGF